jgi:hypothetical protein
MEQNTIFSESIKGEMKATYEKALFLESLSRKKELTLAEAVYILSLEEQMLTEAGLFGKMGGLLDKGIETVINKVVSAKDSLVKWIVEKLGGEMKKKEGGSPFDGAQTILPVAKMAKEDKEGFFQKVASMTGNSVDAIKDLYMKLEGSYEKIPLIGKIASKIPKGWRTVIVAALVAIVAGAVIYKTQTGGDVKAPSAKAPEVAPKAPEVAPKAPEAAPKAPDASAAVDAAQSSLGEKAGALVDKVKAVFEKNPEKGKMLLQKLADTFAQANADGKLSDADALKAIGKMLPPDKADTWWEMAKQAVDMKNKLGR